MAELGARSPKTARSSRERESSANRHESDTIILLAIDIVLLHRCANESLKMYRRVKCGEVK